ncbi:MAG: hypothetical protein QNJ29_11580 [Rhizobiaceae bacterium]|nr:hypothetical protein [Rhizobiaceae bacterium]
MRQLYSRLTENASLPVRLLINLVFLPYFLVRIVSVFIKVLKSEEDIYSLEYSDLRQRLSLSVSETDPAWDRCRRYKFEAVQLLETGNWALFEKYLSNPDLQKHHTFGQSYLYEVFDGIWEHITTDHIDEGDRDHPSEESNVPDHVLARFRAACADDGSNPFTIYLTVDLLQRMAWARWGGMFSLRTKFDPVVQQVSYLEEATRYLELIGSDEQHNSIDLFRNASFGNLAGVSTTPELITNFWEMQRSDPGNLRMYFLLAVFMLSEAGEDDQIFLDMGEEVYERSKAHIGSAGYAVYAMTAFGTAENKIYNRLNMERLVTGVSELISGSAYRQVAVNTLCGFLYFASMEEGDIFGSGDKDQNRVLGQLREIYEKLVRTELKVVYPHRWEQTEQSVVYAIAEVFKEELMNGETVVVGKVA